MRGEVAIDHAQLDDFIIFKGDGSPTYHFAVVVDDADMGITDVIRGEDHISNTPKQLIIYEALGTAPPRFAHIPLIHGTDGGRLSKRHGATAVSDYRRQGFLPEALVNYLALLGWSPGGESEILGRDELIARFDLARVVKTPAVFDLTKLTWMNGVYLAAMPVPERTDRVIPYLEEAGRARAGGGRRPTGVAGGGCPGGRRADQAPVGHRPADRLRLHRGGAGRPGRDGHPEGRGRPGSVRQAGEGP